MTRRVTALLISIMYIFHPLANDCWQSIILVADIRSTISIQREGDLDYQAAPHHARVERMQRAILRQRREKRVTVEFAENHSEPMIQSRRGILRSWDTRRMKRVREREKGEGRAVHSRVTHARGRLHVTFIHKNPNLRGSWLVGADYEIREFRSEGGRTESLRSHSIGRKPRSSEIEHQCDWYAKSFQRHLTLVEREKLAHNRELYRLSDDTSTWVTWRTYNVK